MFEKGVHDSGAKLRLGDYVRVGVECEIAVQLARDLSPSEAPFTAEWVAEAIEAYYPGDRDRRRPLRQMGDDGRADACSR